MALFKGAPECNCRNVAEGYPPTLRKITDAPRRSALLRERQRLSSEYCATRLLPLFAYPPRCLRYRRQNDPGKGCRCLYRYAEGCNCADNPVLVLHFECGQTIHAHRNDVPTMTCIVIIRITLSQSAVYVRYQPLV